ncbi:hypothetical protein NHX12_009106 [Muraenolepis orangiensis]|uniref:Ig-like domain-containing protein n=1 Tax=Muraenolepis orangiensis TaxID=630683 RepID=A0A9Q0IA08_9TELE|nr:hypothetical protein NHX12_009106 [Muraenolepis orangiensis]
MRVMETGEGAKEKKIPCLYTTDDGIGGLKMEWFYLVPTGQKLRIYYQDTTMRNVELGTPFTDRVKVDSEDSKGTGQVNLTIMEAKLGDEMDFFCQVTSLTDGIDEGRTQLRVFETPDVPTIEEVSVDTQMTKESNGLFSVKSELNLKVVKEDKDSVFYCEVNYPITGGFGMQESRRINISVNYPTDMVTLWVQSPKGDIKEGDTVSLQCRGNGNPQPIFTFKYKECWGTPHCLSTLNASCNALSSLDTHTVWTKNGSEVAKGNTLSLRDVGYDMAGAYVCMVTVPQLVGLTTSGELQLIVKGVPEIMDPENTSLEEMMNSMVVLTCSARGVPAPAITWKSTEMQNVSVSSNYTEDGVVSAATVEVTSDMNVSCIASNLHGKEEVLFSIKAITPTSIPSSNTTNSTVTPTSIPSSNTTNSTESKGVIIAVLIICLLLLAVLGSVLYFLYKKGKLCGRSGKQDLTKEKTSRDNIVVEMKSDNTEEAVLLAVNGDKKHPGEQVGERRHTARPHPGPY